ncbi:putative thiolase [Burkholderia lata]|uniref:thiolase C-terminal domain-containing protein n=1 Tax=Burkholderia lata (strain ATCC 17760 / DSM 23089 / LMG 22485 / NCIMB 9086 / R18194 / 383) TaxID=482957 RepID=UPI0014537767|nr:lipid-transfer protein [Burkholderia lata]VWB42814.1 putative thiolase [Burkholderia lata]
MSNQLVIAGVGMVPFVRPGTCEPYDVMAERAVRKALDDAKIDYGLIDQAFASFVYGDSCSGERALYRAGMTGIPITNVNNNCASGSSALYLARQAVLSGAAECALAVGFEEMPPGALGRVFPKHADPLERHRASVVEAMGFGAEADEIAPALLMFGSQLMWAANELGISDDVFARIAVKARTHAKHNPYAIFREPMTVEDVLSAPTVWGRLRKLYACAPSCGAAAVIVCSPAFAKRHGLRSDVVILAHEMQSDIASDLDPPNVPDALSRAATRRTANCAYWRAGVDPKDIDVAELHDCFVSNELISYASLGFCEESDLERFVLDGRNTYGGQVVVCPSGGLLSKGHPLGATGLAQIVELTHQLRGEAGVRQVEGARTALQHNGGLGSAVSVAILQRKD